MSKAPKQNEDLRPLVYKLADRLRFIEGAMKETGNLTQGALHREARAMEREPLEEVLKYYIAVRDAVTILEDLLKYVKRVKTGYEERVIPSKMDVADVTNMTVDGFRVVTTEKLHASVKADAKDEAFAWLQNNPDFGEELKALIIETVNASTLSASIKDAMRTKGKEFPEELFNLIFVPSVSVTKLKPKP